ncbi:MAG: lamin tail domain-containing protein, partial [Lentisphaerota bacterium]
MDRKRKAGLFTLVLLAVAFAGLSLAQMRMLRHPYGFIDQRQSLRHQWIRSASTPGWRRARPGFVLSPVVISQIGPADPRGPFTADGKPSDWIELLNRSEAPVSLLNYSLTDSASRPAKFVLPDITLVPGERMLVWADGLSGISSELSFKFPARRGPEGWRPQQEEEAPSGYAFFGQVSSNGAHP